MHVWILQTCPPGQHTPTSQLSPESNTQLPQDPGCTCARHWLATSLHAIVPMALSAMIPIPNATDVSRGNCMR